jgi:adenosine deaminase
MKNFDPKYNDIPKTEIHCHLEGAIRTQTILDVAREYNLKLPTYELAELDKRVKVFDQLRDLQSVLDAFAIFQNSITSPAVVERIAWELFEDCARQNIKLFEVRFSPDWAFHGHDLDWDESLEALLRAKERAEKEFDMAIGIIAITSRGMGAESCVKTVDWAIRNRQHIQAVDLADGELLYPMNDFVKPILKAKAAGLKVTIHSGEDTPASAVWDTIHAFQPDRIGHGIHSIEDMKVVELIKERNITLEVNPWSNYLTNSVPTIEAHPLKKLFDLGVRVTVNSDDPEVLETNVNNEYCIAHEILGMSMDDIAVCNRYAFESSFIEDAAKQRIWDKYFAPIS